MITKNIFKFLFAFDVETTGLIFSNDNPVMNLKTEEYHQIVSIGIIIADAITLNPIEKEYIEIKWNDKSKQQRKQNPSFGKKAEKIHGLTEEYLENHGLNEQNAVVKIGNLILKYWGPSNPIHTLGHNVSTFDLLFLYDLFKRHGIELNLGHRHVDTYSAGFVSLITWSSDDLFETLGFEPRTKHNALEDIEMTLKSAQIIRNIIQHCIEK